MNRKSQMNRNQQMTHTLQIKTNNSILELPYTIVRSDRKSIGFEVKAGGIITVRLPRRMPLHTAFPVIESKKDWIYEAYLRQKEKTSIVQKRKEEQEDPRLLYLEKKYRKAAKQYIYERVEYYLPFTGGSYTALRIGDQKTRWGSCSSNKTLSFSWRLMLAPPRVLDYVVIHELCHLTYMNHSKEFWAKVESIDPDYREHRKWLKENGDTLILK